MKRKSLQNKGLLVTFEGVDGSGKSTLISAVAEGLRARHPQTEILITREPGGVPSAEKIRTLILETANPPLDPHSELLLYIAARREHWIHKVAPALSRGAVVLCDRFTDSSLAYQGYARGLPLSWIKKLNQSATQNAKIGLTVLLDADPKESLSRVQEWTRFEAEGIAFQRKVRRGFLELARAEPKRWLKLKARSDSPENLASKILQRIHLPK